MLTIVMIVLPLIGAGWVIWGMISDLVPHRRRVHFDSVGLSRRELSRITRTVRHMDRRRGRYGWQA